MKYKKLHDFIASRQNTPFKWGENDCCFFACDAVLAMTGVDHSVNFRGKYDDEKSALRVVKKAGGIRAIASVALGAEIKPQMAQRGDVVLLEIPKPTLGICTGSVVVAPGENGINFISLDQATCAWRVN
jgi:hypothetical protein